MKGSTLAIIALFVLALIGWYLWLTDTRPVLVPGSAGSSSGSTGAGGSSAPAAGAPTGQPASVTAPGTIPLPLPPAGGMPAVATGEPTPGIIPAVTGGGLVSDPEPWRVATSGEFKSALTSLS